MAYKFKLKEAPAPNLAKQGGYKVGDVTYSNDGDTRFTVDAVNPESGKVSWKITNLPNFDKLFDELRDATETAKGVYTKVCQVQLVLIIHLMLLKKIKKKMGQIMIQHTLLLDTKQ